MAEKPNCHESIKQRLARFRSEKQAEQLVSGESQPNRTAKQDCAAKNQAEVNVKQKSDTTPVARRTIRLSETNQPAELEWWTRLPLWLKVTVWVLVGVAADFVGELRAFFVVAGLVGIYAYTRESTRRPGEKSAYSVFNKGFEKIDGTFDYNDFERSLRSGGPV